jgi:rRNA maturation endonuclease Nob1
MYYKCLDCGGEFRANAECHFCPYCGEMHLKQDEDIVVWRTGDYVCISATIKIPK